MHRHRHEFVFARHSGLLLLLSIISAQVATLAGAGRDMSGYEQRLKKNNTHYQKLHRLSGSMMTSKYEFRASVCGPSMSLGKGHRLILSDDYDLSHFRLLRLHQEGPLDITPILDVVPIFDLTREQTTCAASGELLKRCFPLRINAIACHFVLNRHFNYSFVLKLSTNTCHSPRRNAKTRQ